MPKVSIILPCYNVENYLPRAIESVLNQTNPNFELLVVIDGSPDNSKTIAEKYALNDNRIKVFEKPNGGLSDARNYGLERAKGEFVYFMDSDDWIEVNLLEENIKILEEEELDFLIFGYFQDNENAEGGVASQKIVLPKLKQWSKGDLDLKIDHHHLGIMGYAWNKVYRKSFLDEHQFRFQKGVSLVEDILFNAPLYAVSDRIRFNEKAYYHYMNRPVVTLMKTFHPKYLAWKKMKNEALDTFLEAWQFSERKSILADSYINGFRESIHSLFAYQNQLTEKEKRRYIASMYEDELTKERLKDYRPQNMKEKIHFFLVKNRWVNATWLFAKLIK